MNSNPGTNVPLQADIRFQLAEPLSFLKVGERKAVFAEHRQKIFELNDIAAYLASSIVDRPSLSDLLVNLEGRGFTTEGALRSVRKFVTEWSRAKLLLAKVSTKGLRLSGKDTVCIAGHKVALHYYNASLADRISPVFSHLRTNTHHRALVYDIVARDLLAYISQSGKPGAVTGQDQAAPAIKGLLTDAVLDTSDYTIALHCALLVHRGHGLLITGPPGAGKTSLALDLLSRGFEYAADDITLLMNDIRVRGMPFAPALKSGSWKLSQNVSLRLASFPIHRRLDGKRVRYLPPWNLASATPVPVQWIVSLRRSHSGPVQLKAIDTSTILKELIDGAHTKNKRLNSAQLRKLINMILPTSPYALQYANANEAGKVLEQVCERH